MRSFTLFALTGLLAAVGAFAVPADPDAGSELAGSTFLPTPVVDVPATPVRRMTNAERLSRGLPLENPHRRGTPVRRQGGSSPVPTVTYRGYIAVRNAANNAPLGYISRVSASHAQYAITPSIGSALTVHFGLPVGTLSASQVDVFAEDGDTNFGILGLVQGRDDTDPDMRAGSFNYGYLAGTVQTTPGAAPAPVSNSYTTVSGLSRDAESAVWSVDLTSTAMTPHWINSDGTNPNIEYWTQSTALYFGGDINAFHARYSAAVTPIYFQYYPIA